MLVVAVVLVAALLHATWNATAHAVTDRRAGFLLMSVAVTVVAVPALPLIPFPASAAWPYLLGSVVTHLVYNLLLLRSYELGDFGQTYPLARGTAPLVVALASATVVGQSLSPLEVLGVLTISAGLVVLVLGRGSFRAGRPAVIAAVATGLSIATYTVLDGVGVHHADTTQGYIWWLFALQGPLIGVVVAVGRREILQGARAQLVPGLVSGVVSMLAYGLVIWAQDHGRLATVAALRECSIVFGALIGATLFHERMGAVRVLGAVIVLTGVVLLASA